jgi:hypothetical protein
MSNNTNAQQQQPQHNSNVMFNLNNPHYQQQLYYSYMAAIANAANPLGSSSLLVNSLMQSSVLDNALPSFNGVNPNNPNMPNSNVNNNIKSSQVATISKSLQNCSDTALTHLS